MNAIEVARLVRELGLRRAAERLGKSRGAISSLLAGAVARGELAPPGAALVGGAAAYKEAQAFRRIRELEEELRQERASVELALGMIGQPAGLYVPEQRPRRKHSGAESRAVLLMGDWHFGETVEAVETCGFNSYNMDIAKKRVQNVIERAIDISSHHMGRIRLDGMTLFMLGDLVSGDIHDELRETNEKPLIEAALECRDLALWAIKSLAEHYGRLDVHWIFGNHGRTTKKPRAKLAYSHNFDWLIGAMVRRDLDGAKGISVNVPKSGDALADVHGMRILATHGDRLGVKGGDGIIGAIGPVMRGGMKTGNALASLGIHYDLMVMGHWHQVLWLPGIVVNGSIKGHDEWGMSIRARATKPLQALFFVHPTRGITARWEIDAND